jgi:hypothetical protein
MSMTWKLEHDVEPVGGRLAMTDVITKSSETRLSVQDHSYTPIVRRRAETEMS